MVKSMTGYGKAECEIPGGKIKIEIRTLNSKNADISLKTSLFPKDKEMEVRSKLSSSLVRGTIDCFATYESNGTEDAKVINPGLVRQYYEQILSIRKDLPGFALSSTSVTDRLNNEILMSVFRFPDVLEMKKTDVVNDDNWPLVSAALDEAIAAVDEFRIREGAVLREDVTSRVKKILALYDEVEKFEGERLEAVKERLIRNLEELGTKVDPLRFEQEMIYYLEKLDINEEKVRLREHCRYFLETIDGDTLPGKKLGFIIQEMGREINTTGSKANHAPIQKAVVLMKDELEKIREQSMNIL